jgi:2-O-A-mannosyl-D-glycerate-specific PTS system IIC component
MDLSTLTRPELIFINPVQRSPKALIEQMAQSLAQQGFVHHADHFIASVMRREKEGPTALGEALAVPHGKCDSVGQAAFCIALFQDPIMWPGLEGDEDVNLVFLLAIPPAEAGSTHMQLLTQLTSMLVDDSLRQQILSATSADTLMALLSQKITPNTPEPAARPKSKPAIPILLGLIAGAAFISAGLHWTP